MSEATIEAKVAALKLELVAFEATGVIKAKLAAEEAAETLAAVEANADALSKRY